MELGRAQLLSSGINLLRDAVHARHGVAWTDGSTVYLTPLAVARDILTCGPHVTIGRFSSVRGVQWSSETTPTSCYLALVHADTVSLWRSEDRTPQLYLKQVRKLTANPIPHGCLWNPKSDILAVVEKDRCYIFFKHTRHRGSLQLPPLEKGEIDCGSWSDDGTCLMIVTGSLLVAYTWPDIEDDVTKYDINASKIPKLEGRVRCMASGPGGKVLCLCDPASSSVLAAAPDVFALPGGENCEEADIIRPRPGKLESLFSLSATSQAPRQSGGRLVVLSSAGSSSLEVVCSAIVPGLLCPDMLCPLLDNNGCGRVVVGSSSQRSLAAYCLTQGSLAPAGRLLLGEDERPKGLSGVPGHAGALVVLAGRTDAVSVALPSSRHGTRDYNLTLRAFNVLKDATGEGSHEGGITTSSFQMKHDSRLGNGAPHEAAAMIPARTSSPKISRPRKRRAKYRAPPPPQSAYSTDDILDALSHSSGSSGDHHPGGLDTRLASGGGGVKPLDSSGCLSDSLEYDPALSLGNEATLIRDSLGSDSILVRDSGVCVGGGGTSWRGSTPSLNDSSGLSREGTPRKKRSEIKCGVGALAHAKRQGSFDLSCSNHAANTSDSHGLLSSSGSGGRSQRDDANDSIETEDLYLNLLKTLAREGDAPSITELRSSAVHEIDVTSGAARQATQQRPLVELTSGDAEGELEVEKADFRGVGPRFAEHEEIAGLRTLQTRQSGATAVIVDGKVATSNNWGGHVATRGLTRADHVEKMAGKSSRSTERSLSSCGSMGSLHVDLGHDWVTPGDKTGDTEVFAEDRLTACEAQLTKQNESIKTLQERIEEMSRALSETAIVGRDTYGSIDKPECVEVEAVRGDGSVSRRSFLLDGHRLKLQPLLATFGLDTLEMQLDDTWIVVGENIDGYVPLKFEPGTVLRVRGR